MQSVAVPDRSVERDVEREQLGHEPGSSQTSEHADDGGTNDRVEPVTNTRMKLLGWIDGKTSSRLVTVPSSPRPQQCAHGSVRELDAVADRHQ